MVCRSAPKRQEQGTGSDLFAGGMVKRCHDRRAESKFDAIQRVLSPGFIRCIERIQKKPELVSRCSQDRLISSKHHTDGRGDFDTRLGWLQCARFGINRKANYAMTRLIGGQKKMTGGIDPETSRSLPLGRLVFYPCQSTRLRMHAVDHNTVMSAIGAV